MADPFEELQAAVWVLAALGRVARRGLFETPAEDRLDAASQRLLVQAGWLDPNSLQPSQQWQSVVPSGAPSTALSGLAVEVLGTALRYARGAPPGWIADDPDLIRWRSTTSGGVITTVIAEALAELPQVAERLDAPDAAFLDVGVGGAGISIEMCRRHPHLHVVGLDIDPAALAIAREQVAATELEQRIELRQQSVADLHDVAAFDLIWLSQPFIDDDVLTRALPALRRAARPHAAVLMLVATNTETGAIGAAIDLGHLVSGGSTMTSDQARALLEDTGWIDVATRAALGGILALARAPGKQVPRQVPSRTPQRHERASGGGDVGVVFRAG